MKTKSLVAAPVSQSAAEAAAAVVAVDAAAVAGVVAALQSNAISTCLSEFKMLRPANS